MAPELDPTASGSGSTIARNSTRSKMKTPAFSSTCPANVLGNAGRDNSGGNIFFAGTAVCGDNFNFAP